MKKTLTLLLTAAVSAGILIGCGSQTQPETIAETTMEADTAEATTETAATEETTADETEETTEVTTGDTAAAGYKTGMAVISTLDKSKDAKEDADGLAQVDSVAVAVVLDEEGVIVSCVIDTAQNQMNFTSEGTVVMRDDFQTKKELGEAYGMKPASTIGKEWNEQIAAFEEYVIGKTAEEVKAITVNEDTVPEEADLVSSVTIKVGAYIDAVVEAAETAEVIGTQQGDTLGLGIVTKMSKSADATAEKEGQCQAYSTYAAVTVNAEGVITGSVIDCTQGTVTFDQTGTISTNLEAGVKTKRQQGDAYGMKNASVIGKEWFEQAAAFSGYIQGKTAEEVTAIAVDESTYPTDIDLISSVTISIGDFKNAIEKAVK